MLYVMVYRADFRHVTALPKAGENIRQILQYREKGYILAEYEFIDDHRERLAQRSNRKQVVARGRIAQEVRHDGGVRFDRHKVAVIAEELQEALAPILTKYGLEAFQIGQYDADSFDIQIRLANEGRLQARTTAKLKRNNVNPAIFGKPIHYRGKAYQLAGTAGLKDDEFYLRDQDGGIFRCGVRFLKRSEKETLRIDEEDNR